MSRKILGIVGIVLVVLTISFFVFWNVYLEEKISYVDVATLNQTVHENQLITSNLITVKSMEKTTVSKEAILANKAKTMINSYAAQYIPADTQLFEPYFKPENMVIADDEQLVSIPTDWILAAPQTLRRGDEVFFYAFAREDAQIQQILEQQKETNDSQIAFESDDETMTTITIDGEVIDEVISEESTQKDITVLKEDILNAIIKGKEYQIKTTAMYVKDNQNREIVTVHEGTSQGDARLNGTGKIGQIEIKATEEQLDLLQTAVSLGYRFIIAYK